MSVARHSTRIIYPCMSDGRGSGVVSLDPVVGLGLTGIGRQGLAGSGDAGIAVLVGAEEGQGRGIYVRQFLADVQFLDVWRDEPGIGGQPLRQRT